MKCWVILAGLALSVPALAAEPPIRVAITGLQGLNMTPDGLSFYAEHLASNLRAPGLTVTTAREISTMLGLERQKQLLGCGEAATSCIAELANALGVDAVIVGDVGHFGQTYQVNIKVLAAANAKVLASRSARVDGDVAVLDAIASIGAQLAREMFELRLRPVPEELMARTASMTSTPAVRSYAVVPLGVGIITAGLGGVLFGLARSDYAVLTTPGNAAVSPAQATALRTGGAAKQTAAIVLFAVGGAAVLGAGAMYLFGGPATPSVSVVPVQQGAVFSVSGELP